MCFVKLNTRLSHLILLNGDNPSKSWLMRISTIIEWKNKYDQGRFHLVFIQVGIVENIVFYMVAAKDLFWIQIEWPAVRIISFELNSSKKSLRSSNECKQLLNLPISLDIYVWILPFY